MSSSSIGRAGSVNGIALHKWRVREAKTFRAQAGFNAEDEWSRIETELAVEPVLGTLQVVGPFLLQCMRGLFLNVQPRLRIQTSSTLRC